MKSASEESSVHGLLSDDPIEDLASDLFRRGPFADRVIDLLDNVASETPSAVLGLMGPWGSGKTSALQLIRARVSGRGDWTVAEMNPWMMADLPSLIDEFFLSLLSAIPNTDKGKAIRHKLARYAKAVAPFASPFKVLGIDPGKAMTAASGILEGDQSIDGHRKELEDALREHGKPILLIADDLDRLQPDELLLVFKLVRLVGRLPNTYYLLAFDEKSALDVLSSTDLARTDPARALAYLEKVIQVRLDLPPAHPRQVARLLDQLLDAIVAKHEIEFSEADGHRLGSAYHDHMKLHLREPRQVKRYCAQIEATYPLVKGEVDFSDFAVVTFLRTVHPGLVPVLVANKDELTRTKREWPDKPTRDERLTAWRARLETAGVQERDQLSLLRLLGGLFLPIKGALDHMEYAGSHPEQASDRRVGSSEYFDRYFYLGVGESDIQDTRVRAALAEVMAGQPADAWSEVEALVATNAELVLDKLRRMAPMEPTMAERLAPLVASFEATVGGGGFLDRAPYLLRSWAAELVQAAEPENMQRFVEQVATASSVVFLAATCDRIVRASAEASNELSDTQIDLARATIDAIRSELDRQATRPPEEAESVAGLLTYWRSLEPEADLRAWLAGVIDSGRWPMPDVLGLFVPVGSMSSGGPRVPALGDPDLELIEEVLGIEAAIAGMGATAEEAESTFWDTDVSFRNRVRRVQAALRRHQLQTAPNSTPDPRAPRSAGAEGPDHLGSAES